MNFEFFMQLINVHHIYTIGGLITQCLQYLHAALVLRLLFAIGAFYRLFSAHFRWLVFIWRTTICHLSILKSELVCELLRGWSTVRWELRRKGGVDWNCWLSWLNRFPLIVLQFMKRMLSISWIRIQFLWNSLKHEEGKTSVPERSIILACPRWNHHTFYTWVIYSPILPSPGTDCEQSPPRTLCHKKFMWQ